MVINTRQSFPVIWMHLSSVTKLTQTVSVVQVLREVALEIIIHPLCHLGQLPQENCLMRGVMHHFVLVDEVDAHDGIFVPSLDELEQVVDLVTSDLDIHVVHSHGM